MNSRKYITKEIQRKMFHVIAMIIPFLYAYYLSYIQIISFNLFIVIIIIYIEYIKYNKNKFWLSIYKLLAQFMRPYESSSFFSASFMIISFFIISIFFNKHIVIASMLIAALSDGVAAVIGVKFGKTNICNGKSLEGSISFLIITIFILYMLNMNLSYIAIYIISLILTFIELITPTKYDNISIPIISVLILN